MQQGVQVHLSIMRPPVLPANLNRQGAMMGDWADERSEQVVREWRQSLSFWSRLQPFGDPPLILQNDLERLEAQFAVALRDAAAESRRNAIETLAPPAREGESAELIGRQVEPRDA